jgi:hypothetical protein
MSAAAWLGQEPDPERDRLERDLAEAQLELAAYRRAMAVVRPYMDGTERTLEDALGAMRADGLEPVWYLLHDEARA